VSAWAYVDRSPCAARGGVPATESASGHCAKHPRKPKSLLGAILEATASQVARLALPFAPKDPNGGQRPVATRLRLNDGVDLLINIPLDEAEKALRAALLEGGSLRVNMGDEALVINPQQVLYLQAVAVEEEASINGGRRLVERAAG
jgi:hypothetical protein